jgi:hypothetical protein
MSVIAIRTGFNPPASDCPALRDFPPDLIIFVGRPAIAGFASDFIESGPYSGSR